MKEPVDLILKAKILIKSGSDEPIRNAAVAVKNRSIVAAGKAEDILDRYKSDVTISRDSHAVLPGFLDCHTHTQQILLRTSLTDELLPLPPVWTEYLIPFERRLSPELAYISSLLSVASMAKHGSLYFVEAGAPFPEELIKAVEEVGVRSIVTYSTFNVYKNESISAEDVAKKVEDLLRGFRSRNVKIWCSIRQLMMITEDLLEHMKNLCKKYEVGLTMHLNEYQGEVDYALSKYGERPVEVIKTLGLTEIKPFIATHMVYISRDEIEIVRREGLHVCWCPTVDSVLMGLHWLGLQHEVSFGMGSDGGAWGTMDLLHEVKVARAMGKALSTSLHYDKASLSSRRLFRALTDLTKEVFSENVGRVEEGYKADFITIDLRKLGTLPHYDLFEALVSFVEGGVYDAVVDGEFIVKDSRMVKIDEEKLKDRVADLMPKLEETLNELKRSLPISSARRSYTP